MTRFNTLGLCLLLLVATPGFAQDDEAGSKDHPLFTRMPGFFIGGYTYHDFDKFESSYIEGDEKTWEGQFTSIEYDVKEGAKVPSCIQIVRNYENAAKKLGGKVLYKDDIVVEMKIPRNGGNTYLHVQTANGGTTYTEIVVEIKPMDQDVVADASALSASIASTGKAAIYGIYFDTGKSEVKPESAPAIEQIVALLKQNAGLSLYVVGHTDNVGSLESNVKLSADRADAVVKALVAKGIAASRLKPAGVGPYCPIASNKTEEGKAQNRRVELVEQK